MITIFRSFVLNLTPLKGGTLSGAAGELAHAAFYAAINAAEPELARRMHEAQERSAFTLSPLRGYRRNSDGQTLHVSEGQQGWLRVTLLDDELSAVLFRFLQRQPLVMRLGDLQFAVQDALGAPGSHPWAGYSTLTELQAIDQAPDVWTVEFASPLAIRWGDLPNGQRRIVSFPMPRLAVAGLRTRWDRLTGDTWGRAFEEWVEHNVIVSCVWNWHAESFQFQRQSYQGGVGKLEYQLLDPSNRANVIHFHRLLHLAFFTGIGYKTTHGLGQVRLLQSRDES
jgi:CRISPR-associated endoribonuclease Cas6